MVSPYPKCAASTRKRGSGLMLPETGTIWEILLWGLLATLAMTTIMPHLHPRMASEYDEPGSEALLEPPGSST